MGSLTYDGLVVQIDDRVLAHLQIVIVKKLRRGESFVMSWKDAPSVGDGRSAIWLHPTIPIHFKFDGGRVPSINEAWLDELSTSANGPRGLIVTQEEGVIPTLKNEKRPVPFRTAATPVAAMSATSAKAP
jgi:hypothetical protein